MQSTIASIIAALIPIFLILFIENNYSNELIAIYITSLSIINPINQLFNVDIKRVHILSGTSFKENFSMRLIGGLLALSCVVILSIFLREQTELILFCFLLIIMRYFDSIADLLAADFILKEQNYKQIINRLNVLLLFFLSITFIYLNLLSIYFGIAIYIFLLSIFYSRIIFKNFEISIKSLKRLNSNLVLGADSLLTSLTFYMPIYFLTGNGSLTLVAQFGLLQTLAAPLRLVLSSYLYQYLNVILNKQYRDLINLKSIFFILLFFIFGTFFLNVIFEVLFQNTNNTSFISKFFLLFWVVVNSLLFIEISYLVRSNKKRVILFIKIANISFIALSFFFLKYFLKILSIELMQFIIILSELIAFTALRIKR